MRAIASYASRSKKAEYVWDPQAVSKSLVQSAKIHGHSTGYVYVDRGCGLAADRWETLSILDSGEAGNAPTDMLKLFMLKTLQRADRRVRRGLRYAFLPAATLSRLQYRFADINKCIL